MESIPAAWRALEGIGGGLSLFVVVALALAGAALGLVHALAAVLVLERFARAARGWAPTLLFALGACLGFGAALTRWADPSLALAPFEDWLRPWLRTTLASIPLCVVSLLVCRVLQLERVRRPMAWLSLIALLLAALLALFCGGGFQAAGVRLLRAAATMLVLGLLPHAAAGFVAMRASAEWRIAVRYLVAERRQVFVSVITLICVLGVASGVWLIVTVLSVMNGFERTWREQIADSHAHFVVHSRHGRFAFDDDLRAAIEEVEGVEALSPVLEAEGMARSAAGRLAPVRLRGLDPATAADVENLEQQIEIGSLAALDAPGEAEAGLPGLLIGAALAERLDVEVGDQVALISPFGGPSTPLGPAPRLLRFRVVGRFVSNFMQYDEIYAWASLDSTRRFLDLGEVVDGVEVRSPDFHRSRRVALRVGRHLGYPFYTRDWKELYPQLFRMLESNRSLMFLLLGMIMIVAAFVIVVTLLMMIMAKASDIGILKTMGASDESIESIFAIEGALIGLTGVTLGLLAGIAVTGRLAWIQARVEQWTGIDTLPARIYQASSLPAHVDPLQAAGVAALAFTLALGASFLPSRHAARIDPVEALRQD